MKRRLMAAGSVAMAMLAVAALGAAQKTEESWVSLFDGKTLSGWTTADGTEGNWKVENGEIHGSGPASHLFSPKGDYKNFRYKADFKIADKANSGEYFRTAKGPGFPKGYEAQVNSTHSDPARTGTLYSFVKVTKMLVPPDTWFTQEIEAVGNHIIIKVNDEKVVDFVDEKNTFMKGYFAFQQHDPGSQVWIKNIQVMELPDSPAEAVTKTLETPKPADGAQPGGPPKPIAAPKPGELPKTSENPK